MKKILFSNAIILLFLSSPFQKESNYRQRHRIYLKELGCTISDDIAHKEVTKEYKDSLKLVYYLLDNYGSLRFRIYDNKQNLIEEGNYQGIPNLLSWTVEQIDVVSNKKKLIKEKYYKPKPVGTWFFYSMHKIIKRKFYGSVTKKLIKR